MNIFQVIFIVAVVVAVFVVYRICGHKRRRFMNRILSSANRVSRRRAEDYWKNLALEGPYFHVQKARPTGILFSIVGIAGLCGTWIFATSWESRIALTIILGTFVVVGVAAVIGGGCWRSRFDGGHVYWEYPSRFYGKNDSCCIKDVVEFQHTSREDSSRYDLVLKDGTKKRIEQHCFGYAALFLGALQEENPRIAFTEKYH